MLGIWNDPWYNDTNAFLAEAIEYLSAVAKDNTAFFALQDRTSFEVILDDINPDAA